MEKVNNKIPKNLSLSVKNKLYIGFALVAVLAAAIGVVGYTQMGAVNDQMDFILFTINVVKDCSDEMVVETMNAVEATNEYIGYSYGDVSVLNALHDAEAEFDNLEAITIETAEVIDDSELTKAVEAVSRQHPIMVAKAKEMMDEYDFMMAQHSDMTVLMDDLGPYVKEFDVEVVKLVDLLEELEATNQEIADHADETAEKMVETADTMIIGITVAAVAIAIGLGVYISNGITKPLAQLISDSNIVASGTLGHQFVVQDRDDEIGDVITSIKGMVQNTANLVGSVQNAADTVVSMSQELSSTAQQANASMQQVSSATQQIAQGAAQLSSLSQESSQNANRLSAVLQQTGANSAKAGESIQQIMTAMETTTSTVENMDLSLDKIGDLANIVTDVANQTQLLALNAAIEAARAGEAGRGFAVVADAVRELSEQTNVAAADTLKSVGDVQKNGKDAIDVAQGSTTEAAAGVDVVNETIVGVNQGVEAVEAVVKAIDEMASIAEEAASSAEENTAAAEEQTAAMGQLANNASNLEEIATQLQAEMAKFTL